MYQILIGIIKSKFIAVLLGPAGMGIQGLYQSTLDVIKSLTALGLEQSAVRDISEANGCKDAHRIGRTVATVRRLVWMTGTLGLVATLILSPLLSQWTFGNGDYTFINTIAEPTVCRSESAAAGRTEIKRLGQGFSYRVNSWSYCQCPFVLLDRSEGYCPYNGSDVRYSSSVIVALFAKGPDRADKSY